ncbi:hypothetical protein [Novipirellula rosea]|uniref:DUF1843 domain-containing protein n=1 Tax=Novipirellula rosea TaxID=1031540 RepID=A0ABP8NGA3_9BACT
MQNDPKPIGRVQFMPMDAAAIYATLAPLVTEAHAYLESGNEVEGMKALAKAREVITIASNTMTSIQFVEEPSASEGKEEREPSTEKEAKTQTSYLGKIRK